MSKVTNDVLLEKIENLHYKIDTFAKSNDEAHISVNEHLAKLNGQTARNTQFITMTKGTIKGIALVGTCITFFFGIYAFF